MSTLGRLCDGQSDDTNLLKKTSSIHMKTLLLAVTTIFFNLGLGFHQRYSLVSNRGTQSIDAIAGVSARWLQRRKLVPMRITKTPTSVSMSGKDDAISRRKSRRNRRREKTKEYGKDTPISQQEKNFFPDPEPSQVKTSEGLEGRFVEKQITPEIKARTEQTGQVGNTGQQSIEEAFGLGDEQLRELMGQELPVPREDLSTGKELNKEQVDENKVFNLPDLSSFLDDKTDEKKKESDVERAAKESRKIDRRNREEYDRILQLNPFADG